ncbi:DUF3054 domain-containing protein [Rothia sp. LK2588]|uniref:DUF3054 domain-containing protein n=1 Tax=Rothia sp. LK2588 TaxID=3114369 RepID=UPI0034CF1CCB
MQTYSTSLRNVLVIMVVDIALILGFAVLGRSSHHETLLGSFNVALPFVIAYLISWFIPIVRRQPHNLYPAGVLVWLMVALGGQALRVLTGGTTALSFIMVTLAVLGAFILGWRLILMATRRVSKK